MISSVDTSARLYRASIMLRSCAYTDATPARTSGSFLNALFGVSASCGTSVRFVQALNTIGAGAQSRKTPTVIRPIDLEKRFRISLMARKVGRESGSIGVRSEADVRAERE